MLQRGRLMTVKIKDDFYLSLYEKIEKCLWLPYVLGAMLNSLFLYILYINWNSLEITYLNLFIGYTCFTICSCMIYFGFYIIEKSSKYAKMKSKAYKLGMRAYPTTCILKDVYFQNKYFKKAFCDGYFQMILEKGFDSENSQYRIL